MTQRALAERVNIDFSYLSKIESGVVPPPSEKVILQLAEALNADKDELIILAGKVPSDIVQILKNGETLQRLRSARAKQMARSSKKREGTTVDIMKQLVSYKSYKSLSKIAIPIVLVIAVAASLWFAAPVRALDISFPSLPSGNLGSTHSFSVKIDITDAELLPIQSIKLEIYNSANPTTYKATCTSLPLTATTKSYTSAETGGGAVSITATVSNWDWLYGYGYAFFEDTGHYFDYLYGYGYGGATASITYTGTWTSPSGWPAGGYKAKATITANATTFTKTSSTFTLSAAAAAVEAGAPVRVGPPAGVTYVSDVTTAEGVFTEDVIAESKDGKVELAIDENTVGQTKKGKRLTKITIAKMKDPPAPPEDSIIIGRVYDLGPEGATFNSPATLTFTYDPTLLPADVAEENLVIAMWDKEAGEWVNLVSTVDPVANTITARVSHFTAFTVIAYTRPAAFTTTNLVITPDEVNIGETVTVSALVTNTGDLTASYKVTFKIDNVAVATKDVTLVGSASQKVTFTTSKDVTGTYAVNVDGLSSTLVVKTPPVPPAPPPPAPAPPVAPPAAPPVAPPVAPPAPPVAVNWWLISGIIAAVIIISIATILVVRRQRT